MELEARLATLEALLDALRRQTTTATQAVDPEGDRSLVAGLGEDMID